MKNVEGAQPGEGADDIDAYGDGPWAVENVGGHEGAMLGEGIRQMANIALGGVSNCVGRGCGHNL